MRLLPRFRKGENELHRAQMAAIQSVIIEARDDDESKPRFYGTAAGDERKLRGIPAIGRGVTGATDRSIPHVHGIPSDAM